MKLTSNTNKSSTLVLGFTLCLAGLSFSLPSFASYSSLPEESFSLSTGVQIVSPTWQKSLAEFGDVLTKRLAGVWQEVRGLVWDRLLSSISSTTSPSTPTVDVTALLQSGIQQLPSYFTDTASDSHAYFINLLAKEGIVAGQQGKFYPDNYLRLYDLIKMTVDLYRDKVWYASSGEQWLSLEWAFSGDTSLPSRYVATALQLWFLSHIQWDYQHLQGVQKFVSSQDIAQMLVNVWYEFTGMIHNISLENIPQVTRGVAAEYLVKAFDLSPQGFALYQASQIVVQTPFIDIFGHQYQSAISTLAGLGIVSTESKSFYPDNYLHRYDFTIMLVNSLLYGGHQTLNPSYLSGFSSPFADVIQSSYSPFVYYASDHHLIDFLVVNKRGQSYFLPDQLMTKYEIYTLITKATGITFSYDPKIADQEYMTRGELAQLLVDTFGFTLPQPAQTTTSSSDETGNNQLSILLQIKNLLANL